MSFKMDNGFIFIVFDTNIIKPLNSNLNNFTFGETYKVFKKFIYGNSLNNIKLCIPKIVVEELVTQYIEEFRTSKNKIQEAYDNLVVQANRVDWEVDLVKNFDITSREYVDHIKKDSVKYLESLENTIILDYPSNDKMEKIIDRSIKKKKPFFKGTYRKKDFSDAGFKDVIFLESIIEFSEKNHGDYFIVTKDGFLQETDIKQEFGCKCTFLDIDTGIELKNYFKREYGIDDVSKYKQFVETNYFRETIEKVLKNEIINASEEINVIEIEGNTVIENMTIISDGDHETQIIVVLSEENDFIEIKDFDSGEVLYEWVT